MNVGVSEDTAPYTDGSYQWCMQPLRCQSYAALGASLPFWATFQEGLSEFPFIFKDQYILASVLKPDVPLISLYL